MLLVLGEFYATVRRVGYAPLAIVGLLGVIAMPILTHVSSVFAIAGVTVLATVLVVLVYSLANRRNPLENASITVFGMVWVGLLSFVVPFGRSEHPVAFVIMVGLVCAMVDIGSYFVGRGFGSRPLAPTLSPNKTVEGFIGGVVFGVMTAAVLSTLPPYGIGFTAAILGAVAPLVRWGTGRVDGRALAPATWARCFGHGACSPHRQFLLTSRLLTCSFDRAL